MSRSTNNIGGDSSEKSSIKVHHAPGGKSNFSLSWGHDEPQQQPVKKNTSQNMNEEYKNSGAFGTKKNHEQYDCSHTSVKVHHAPGGSSNFSLSHDNPNPYQTSSNSYGYGQKKENVSPYATDSSNQNAKTSVKVHNPPGGRSNFTLS
eukprot:CAMPEP_0114578768 /NCGR_PEP_ID=MMETSP0125-20121206/3276_1 /TAXON_ID=485358 ORGANISM="Aristerostoma sp., Strain ATCC 50986" /NCGR_SAMPLE_ID=MMETSP0125 /ASSEMBLY_ACC=CAM_ASM_000245 /LENGTH=147 /DNA_ID=CAMNT_0001769105 /DNA_START=55 /DNA_END=498 /DNA_ORIENTATION=+